MHMPSPIGRLTMLTACGLSALWALPVHSADPFAGIHQVEVFANATMVITSPAGASFPVRIYRVDGIAQAEAMANQGLPQNPQDAQRHLAARGAEIRRRVEPLVRNALQGLQLAQKYQLDRMPAIVINRQSVVFGLTDVGEALHRYQAHRGASPQPAAAPLPPGSGRKP